MSRALVPLAKGFEDIEAVTIIDVLRRGGVEVVTASIGKDVNVLSAHGILMCADAIFSKVADETFDAIILPGGGEGTENLKAFEPLLERLRRQKEDGGLVCAICAAPTVLEAAGVIEEDQHITCYPTCAMEMEHQCSDAPAIRDGQIITGQAPGSAMLFALVVLSTLTDDKTAQKVARGMVTDDLL